jgi:hypothetical protein
LRMRSRLGMGMVRCTVEISGSAMLMTLLESSRDHLHAHAHVDKKMRFTTAEEEDDLDHHLRSAHSTAASAENSTPGGLDPIDQALRADWASTRSTTSKFVW